MVKVSFAVKKEGKTVQQKVAVCRNNGNHNTLQRSVAIAKPSLGDLDWAVVVIA
jgi:hypothetical protein